MLKGFFVFFILGFITNMSYLIYTGETMPVSYSLLVGSILGFSYGAYVSLKENNG